MGMGNRVIEVMMGMDKSGIPNIETYVEKDKEGL
jgi:hypothetical protein